MRVVGGLGPGEILALAHRAYQMQWTVGFCKAGLVSKEYPTDTLWSHKEDSATLGACHRDALPGGCSCQSINNGFCTPRSLTAQAETVSM